MIDHRTDGIISKSPEAGDVAVYARTLSSPIDLALAGNPYGPSPTVTEKFNVVAEEVGYRIGAYPHIAPRLVEKIKAFHGIPPEQGMNPENLSAMNPDVYLGSGCTGIIQDVFNSGLISSDEYFIAPDATFPVPAGFAAQNSMGIIRVSLLNNLRVDFAQMRRSVESAINTGCKVSLAFFANPNNPTGYVEPTSSIIEFAKSFPQILVMVSEANIDYVPEPILKKAGGSLLESHNLRNLPNNMLVLRSFSKSYGLADDRVGYAVGDKDLLDALRLKSAPFNISGRALINAMIALDDQEHVAKCRKLMKIETKKISDKLHEFGFPDITQSESNLLVAAVPAFFTDSDELEKLLRERGCSVVSCHTEFGRQLKDRYIRIAPSISADNDRFLEILGEICRGKEKQYFTQARTKPPTRDLDSILQRRNGDGSISPPPTVVQSTNRLVIGNGS